MKIDVSEFEGDVKGLSKILEKKLQRTIDVNRSILHVEDKISKSKIRDVLKHALHKLEPNSYRVVSKTGSFTVKKLKLSSHKIKRKRGTPPSAPQSLPYFFPG